MWRSHHALALPSRWDEECCEAHLLDRTLASLGSFPGNRSGGVLSASSSGSSHTFQKTEIKWKNVCSLTDVIICPGLTSVHWHECQVHFNMFQLLLPRLDVYLYLFLMSCTLAHITAVSPSDISKLFNICSPHHSSIYLHFFHSNLVKVCSHLFWGSNWNR